MKNYFTETNKWYNLINELLFVCEGVKMNFNVEVSVKPIEDLISFTKTIYDDLSFNNKVKKIKACDGVYVKFERNGFIIETEENKELSIEENMLINKLIARIEILEKVVLEIQEEKLTICKLPDPEIQMLMFEYMQFALNNETKELWKNLLIKELTTESSTNKRTLSIIRDLSKDEIIALKVLSKMKMHLLSVAMVNDNLQFKKMDDYFFTRLQFSEFLQEINSSLTYNHYLTFTGIGLLNDTTVPVENDILLSFVDNTNHAISGEKDCSAIYMNVPSKSGKEIIDIVSEMEFDISFDINRYKISVKKSFERCNGIKFIEDVVIKRTK
ncbi:MAG: DUF2806 domain-containing protein [Mycoplasmatales bacterium]